MIDYISREPITKGWSGDKKYRVTTADGTKYLLRVSPSEQYDRKKTEFEMMQRVVALGIPMCFPVEFGTCDEGVYSLQSWIDGSDAEDIISTIPDTEQYAYGLEAGRILKTIHSIPAPATQEDWETRFNRKIDRKIKMYNDCPIKYENGQAFIDYINVNRHLLKDRPQCYQHGDYHIGNMMIDPNGKLQIIDFDRDDFGDPWEEFNRIVWCAQKVQLFASGMVNGYFDSAVPDKFWRLLALYISSNTLSSVPWAIPFGQKEIDTMLNQAKEVLSWYDNMKNPVPTWYKGIFEMPKQIEDYIKENLSDDDCKIALDFTSFLKAHHLQFVKDDSACWKDKIYYWINHTDKCVCFIAIMDPDEKENRWTVWPDDIDSKLLIKPSIPENLRKIAWEHIDHCRNCGSCSGGRHKTIFGKEFDDVCGCTFRFDNPTTSDLSFIKEMIEILCRNEENKK